MLTYICAFMNIYVYVCGKEGRKTVKKTLLLAYGQGVDGIRYNNTNRNYFFKFYICHIYSSNLFFTIESSDYQSNRIWQEE